MADPYLESRLEFLLRTQNADGGWAYFPGRLSWLEPTVYAMLALWWRADARRSLERAWPLVESWQLQDGSWRPSAQVRKGTWVTALALLICLLRNPSDDRCRRGVHWLVHVAGAESSMAMRVASLCHMLASDVNVQHKAWPWMAGNASWIEPTVHALVALKHAQAAFKGEGADLASRIRDGEEMILARRGQDGGWNCGNPNVYKIDLPSYPETTALAMLGLQGLDLPGLVDEGWRWLRGSKSSLANAWLTIALRCYGADAPQASGSAPPSDIMLAALQALSHPLGNYRVFQTSVRARDT